MPALETSFKLNPLKKQAPAKIHLVGTIIESEADYLTSIKWSFDDKYNSEAEATTTDSGSTYTWALTSDRDGGIVEDQDIWFGISGFDLNTYSLQVDSGDDNYVNLHQPFTLAYELGGKPFTNSFWFKTSTANVKFISRGDTDITGQAGATFASALINGIFNVKFNGSDWQPVSNTAYNDDAWHHAVITIPASLFGGSVYVDNVLQNNQLENVNVESDVIKKYEMNVNQDIIIGKFTPPPLIESPEYSFTYKRRTTDSTPVDNSNLNDYNTVFWGWAGNTTGNASSWNSGGNTFYWRDLRTQNYDDEGGSLLNAAFYPNKIDNTGSSRQPDYEALKAEFDAGSDVYLKVTKDSDTTKFGWFQVKYFSPIQSSAYFKIGVVPFYLSMAETYSAQATGSDDPHTWDYYVGDKWKAKYNEDIGSTSPPSDLAEVNTLEALTIQMKFDQTISNPGDREFSLYDTNPYQNTQIKIDENDYTGASFSNALDTFETYVSRPDYPVFIYACGGSSNASSVQIFEVTDLLQDAGSYRTYNVIHRASGSDTAWNDDTSNASISGPNLRFRFPPVPPAAQGTLKIDEVSFFDYYFNKADVFKAWNHGVPSNFQNPSLDGSVITPEEGLLAYYRFEEGAGLVSVDCSAYTRDSSNNAAGGASGPLPDADLVGSGVTWSTDPALAYTPQWFDVTFKYLDANPAGNFSQFSPSLTVQDSNFGSGYYGLFNNVNDLGQSEILDMESSEINKLGLIVTKKAEVQPSLNDWQGADDGHDAALLMRGPNLGRSFVAVDIGASGQTLQVNDNADGYTWGSGGSGGSGDVSTDDIWTAAGDLVVGSGLSAAGILPKGTDNSMLIINDLGNMEWEVIGSLAGAGLAQDSINDWQLKVDADGTSIMTDSASGKLKVNVASTNHQNLEVVQDGLQVKNREGSALTSTAGGLGVNVDQSTLTIEPGVQGSPGTLVVDTIGASNITISNNYSQGSFLGYNSTLSEFEWDTVGRAQNPANTTFIDTRAGTDAINMTVNSTSMLDLGDSGGALSITANKRFLNTPVEVTSTGNVSVDGRLGNFFVFKGATTASSTVTAFANYVADGQQITILNIRTAPSATILLQDSTTNNVHLYKGLDMTLTYGSTITLVSYGGKVYETSRSVN